MALTRNERRRMRRSVSVPDLPIDHEVDLDSFEPLPSFDLPIVDPVDGEPESGDPLLLEVPPLGGDEANLPTEPLPQSSDNAPASTSIENVATASPMAATPQATTPSEGFDYQSAATSQANSVELTPALYGLTLPTAGAMPGTMPTHLYGAVSSQVVMTSAGPSTFMTSHAQGSAHATAASNIGAAHSRVINPIMHVPSVLYRNAATSSSGPHVSVPQSSLAPGSVMISAPQGPPPGNMSAPQPSPANAPVAAPVSVPTSATTSAPQSTMPIFHAPVSSFMRPVASQVPPMFGYPMHGPMPASTGTSSVPQDHVAALHSLQLEMEQLRKQIARQSVDVASAMAAPAQPAVVRATPQPNSTPPTAPIRIAPPGAGSAVQLVGGAARYTLPLPAELNTDPKSLNWFEWAPTVQQFFASINCPDILSPPPRSNSAVYDAADHAQCIHLLLQMIPQRDRVWYIKQNFEYVYDIWSSLEKEHGRHDQAHFQALLKEFDLAQQSETEKIHEYLTRLSRLVKDLANYDLHPDARLHKLKLLNVLPVIPGSDAQHQFYLGDLQMRMHNMTVSELELELIRHEEAILRRQEASDHTAQMRSHTEHAFPIAAGTQTIRLRKPLSRPHPRPREPHCIICFNDRAGPNYLGHGTRACPKQETAAGREVCQWLRDNRRSNNNGAANAAGNQGRNPNGGGNGRNGTGAGTSNAPGEPK